MPEPTYRIAQRLHERRAAVGLPKYGRHLDADSQGCMLVHALEESADQVNYLLAEIQRRRTAIKLMLEVAEVLTDRGMHRDAVRVITMIDLLGGESALAQYDEILGGGTVAENATVDPRAMVADGIAELRASLPTDATNEAKPEMREYRFDRYVNGKLKAEGAALVAANDREAAEKLTKLCCDHPVILIGFAVQPTNDPRDEALRVADKALAKVIGYFTCKEFVTFSESHLISLACEARESIRAAGGAR